MGRFEAGDPPPFLVDEDRRITTPDALSQRTDEGAHLTRIDAITGEQDETKRIGVGEEAPFRPI